MPATSSSSPDPRWCLVVPVKRLELAKSRLTGHSADERSALALSFAADTVAAALCVPVVVDVVVVTDDVTAARAMEVLGAKVVGDEPDAGLNPALRHGAAVAASLHPDCGIGTLSADLPALRSGELERALHRAGTAATSVVPDARGNGTTGYFARPGAAFAPSFGPDSVAAHLRGGATALPVRGLASLRRDVDTPADLKAAVRLGVGPHTRAVLERMAARAGETEQRREFPRGAVRWSDSI